MQVNATIIAAQQAAREARVALTPPAAPKAAASFLATLDQEGVEPAPARTAAKPAPATQPAPQAFMRPGSLLDIKI